MEFPAFTVPDEGNPGGTVQAPAQEPQQAPPADGSAQGGAPSPSTAPGQPPDEEMFPKHRYDAVAERAAAAERRADQMAQLLQRMLVQVGQQQQPQQPQEPELPPEEIERRQGIVAQLEEVLPGISKMLRLVGHVDTIESLIEQNQQTARYTQEQLDRYAQHSLASVIEDIAPLVLGEKLPNGQPVTGKALNQVQAEVIKQTYIQWVGETADRRARYDRGDEAALRAEFKTAFEQGWVAPFRRDSNVAAVQRQQRIQKLPVSGTSSAPVTGGPPKPDLNDEDAVYKTAAKMAMAAQAQ